jgi:hypothetical protein
VWDFVFIPFYKRCCENLEHWKSPFLGVLVVPGSQLVENKMGKGGGREMLIHSVRSSRDNNVAQKGFANAENLEH